MLKKVLDITSLDLKAIEESIVAIGVCYTLTLVFNAIEDAASMGELSGCKEHMDLVIQTNEYFTKYVK